MAFRVRRWEIFDSLSIVLYGGVVTAPPARRGAEHNRKTSRPIYALLQSARPMTLQTRSGPKTTQPGVCP